MKRKAMAIDDQLDRMRAARIKPPPKVKKPMRKKSLKKQAEEAEQKKLLSSDGDTLMEQFFKTQRKRMVGICQCGCGEESQKKDDLYFRHSIAHIFPKHLFPSVMYHPANWVERRFWGGCHSVMDDTSMDRWPNMADFEDIQEKFFILAPLLTPEEKATNFYTRLEKLVYGN
jgi:hypothetical protein